MGFFPSNDAIQTMTSYLGRVVLFALLRSGSRNISTTTFAAAAISTRFSPFFWLDGVILQDAVIFKAARLESLSGSRLELRLIFGKE